jgi:hypothetical protein
LSDLSQDAHTGGMTGAELCHVCREAALGALRLVCRYA